MTSADKRKNGKLTEGPIRGHLIRLAIPASLGMVFNTLYNLTDNWFAGRISDQALAGLSIASTVFALFLVLAMGLQSGTSAMMAPDISRGRNKRAIEWMHNATGIAVLASLGIAGLGALGGEWLLGQLSDQAETVALAWDYTFTVLLGNLGFCLSFMAAGALMACGNTRSNRNVLIVGFVLNWLLNPLFIYTFDLGVTGLALSTVVIKLASAAWLLYVLVGEIGAWPRVQLRWRKWKHLLGQIVPASMNMLTVIVGAFIAVYFIAFFGDAAVAGYSVGIRIEQLLLLAAMGLNAAIMAVAGQSYGVKDYARVRATWQCALWLGLWVSLAAIPAMIFLSPLMLSLFTDNEEIIAMGVYYLRVDALAFYGYITLFSCVAVLQAIKQPLFPMVIGVLRQIVLPLLANGVLIVWLDFPVYAIYWSIVGIVLASALLMWLYTRRQLQQLERRKKPAAQGH